MRLFHLADLHIGKTVNGFSMLEDQRFILERILELVRSEKPDAVLIAGDVYDRQTPGAEAVEVFDAFLTSLTREAPATVIVSGNHDSPERLGFASRIMASSGVYLRCAFSGALHCVTLSDEWGMVNIYTLPFIKPVSARRFFTEPIESYGDAVRAAVNSAQIDPSQRNVLVAHQFFAGGGADPERSESELDPVGGLDRVDCEAVAGFDYVALGHLHAPQRVGGDNIRYAGSPLKYSFSECRHQKSVAIVELGTKNEMSVRLLPLTPLRDLRRVKGPLDELLKAAESTQDYMHVTLTDEDEMHDAIGKVRRVYPNCMALSFENARTRAVSDFSAEVPVQTLTPLELFEAFYEEQNGAKLSGAQAKIVSAALAGGENV